MFPFLPHCAHFFAASLKSYPEPPALTTRGISSGASNRQPEAQLPLSPPGSRSLRPEEGAIMRSGPRHRIGMTGLGCVPGDFAAPSASDMKMAAIFHRSFDGYASNHVIGGQFGSAFRAFHLSVSTSRINRARSFAACQGGLAARRPTPLHRPCHPKFRRWRSFTPDSSHLRLADASGGPTLAPTDTSSDRRWSGAGTLPSSRASGCDSLPPSRNAALI